MKKIYLRPETCVAHIEVVEILAGSPNNELGVDGTTSVNGSDLDTKSNNDWNIWD